MFNYFGKMNKKNEEGQALVEFALILPVFLIVVFGIIQFAFYLNGQVTLAHASREGVRMAAVRDDSDDPEVKSRVLNIISPTPFLTVDEDNIHIHREDKEVTVDIGGTVTSFMPFLSGIIEDSLSISSSSVMQIEELVLGEGGSPIDMTPEFSIYEVDVHYVSGNNKLDIIIKIAPEDVDGAKMSISLFFDDTEEAPGNISWEEMEEPVFEDESNYNKGQQNFTFSYQHPESGWYNVRIDEITAHEPWITDPDIIGSFAEPYYYDM